MAVGLSGRNFSILKAIKAAKDTKATTLLWPFLIVASFNAFQIIFI